MRANNLLLARHGVWRQVNEGARGQGHRGEILETAKKRSVKAEKHPLRLLRRNQGMRHRNARCFRDMHENEG
jgi:hypothetical protein